MLTRDGPHFKNKTTPLIIRWRLLNNSVHLNLLRFELLSRENETEHYAAINMVNWSAPVIRASLVIWKFTCQVSFKRQLTLLGDAG